MADKWIHDDDRVFEWIKARSGLVRVADFIGIGCERDGAFVSAFGYDHHQDLSCFMHIAAEPGGLTRGFVRKAFWIPYCQWGYNVTMGMVQSRNLRSLEVAARLGYAEMLVIPGAHPSGGLHLLAMYKYSCPWLPENKNNVRRKLSPECPEHVGQRQHGE